MFGGDLKSFLGLLDILRELEITIAELYKTASEIWVEDEKFWLDLVNDENSHAKGLSRLAELLNEKPEIFGIGRIFNPTAVKTVISGIKTNIQRLKQGEITKKNILFIARDIEQSLLEKKHNEMVKTNNIEYRTIAEKIRTETIKHEDKINKKIAEMER